VVVVKANQTSLRLAPAAPRFRLAFDHARTFDVTSSITAARRPSPEAKEFQPGHG
jgi:hypothetical protein